MERGFGKSQALWLAWNSKDISNHDLSKVSCRSLRKRGRIPDLRQPYILLKAKSNQQTKGSTLLWSLAPSCCRWERWWRRWCVCVYVLWRGAIFYGGWGCARWLRGHPYGGLVASPRHARLTKWNSSFSSLLCIAWPLQPFQPRSDIKVSQIFSIFWPPFPNIYTLQLTLVHGEKESETWKSRKLLLNSSTYSGSHILQRLLRAVEEVP